LGGCHSLFVIPLIALAPWYPLRRSRPDIGLGWTGPASRISPPESVPVCGRHLEPCFVPTTCVVRLWRAHVIAIFCQLSCCESRLLESATANAKGLKWQRISWWSPVRHAESAARPPPHSPARATGWW